jgi:hypothetical protein
MDFPVTPYAYQTVSFGGYDGFVTRVSPSGAELLYSTYFPGASGETILGIAVDPSGAIYATGRTSSEYLPATPGAFADELRGSSDAFVAKLGARTWAATTLYVPTAVGTVAQPTDLRAVYAVAGSGEPLAGYDVRFRVAGTFVGIATTDGTGTATLLYAVPTGLAPWAVIEASCAGDAVYHCATGAGFLIVNRAATALAVDDASGAAGSTVLLSAVLSRVSDGAPLYGAITFTDNGTRIGRASASSGGRATLSYLIPGSAPLGPHTIGAEFTGNADYEPSSGFATLNVLIGTTLLTVDRNGTISELVTLRAYLRRSSDLTWLDGLPIGFKVDGTSVGSAVTGATGTSGRADLNWTIAEGPAMRTITAELAGDATYAPSADDATLTCLSWTTKMASFDRTARITDRTELKCRLLRSDNVPLYGKTIRFYVDGTHIIDRPTNADGYASYPYYTVPDGAGAGVRSILSEWPGNGGYAAISETATLTVNKAIPYIWVLPRTIPQGAIANLYAYFRRLYDYRKQAGKTLDFKVDGTVVQTVVTDGNGVSRYLYPTTEPVGVHTIRCEFYGDAWLEAGYGEANLTIY